MIVDFKPNDEEGRALALERYQILDTANEQSFENVVTLIQEILEVPMCAVSLVDRDRLWFKAHRGMPADEIAREKTFCSAAIEGTEPLIVSNALEDPRFVNAPVVVDNPYIRAYAGIPLRTLDGYNVGSLCAIDTNARDFSEDDISILENFAKLVVDELELRQAAASDHLTRVLSRRGWMDRAEKEVERSNRYARPVSLALLDIDSFKLVNDTHGHAAGDAVIKNIADLCLKSIRTSDFCGRLGGEEFAIMMPESPLATAEMLAERIRSLFEGGLINVGGPTPLSCTISVGVAEKKAGENDIDALLKRADMALYKAKNEGRNRVAAAA